MNDKLLSLLGLCRRAGRLAAGFEQTLQAISQKQAALVLVTADTAPRTEKEVRFKSNHSLPVIRITRTKEEVSHAIGTAAGTVAVTDEGFAKQLMLLIEGGTNI